MQVTINLDTQAVITAPSPLRMKAGAQTLLAIAFIRNNAAASLADDAVIEFGFTPQTGWTDGPVVYRLAFTKNGLGIYTGAINCATESLFAAFGSGKTLNVDCEVTWSTGGIKTRSATFAGIIEKPVLSDNATPSPDPQLYPPPEEIALKGDVVSAFNALYSVPNRFTAAHAGWKLGDIIKQTGDSLLQKATITINSDIPVTWNGGDTTDPEDGTWLDMYYIGVDLWDTNGNGGNYQPVMNGWQGPLSKEDVAANFANDIASQIGFVSVSVAGNVITLEATSPGSLPADWQSNGGWNWPQVDVSLAVTQSGYDGLPPGNFIVVDPENLTTADGYNAIGNTVDFLNGYGAPTASLGGEGSGYVDMDNGDFYYRDESGWTYLLNLKGPQGATGATGLSYQAAMASRARLKSWQPTVQVITVPSMSDWSVQVATDGTNVFVVFNQNYITKITAATGVIAWTKPNGPLPSGYPSSWMSAISGGSGVTALTDGSNLYIADSKNCWGRLEFGSGLSSSGLSFQTNYARNGSAAENDIAVALVDAGTSNATLSVIQNKAAKTLVVNLATNSSSQIISTALQVRNAVAAIYDGPTTLVQAGYGGNGSGVVSAQPATHLSGGSDTAYWLCKCRVDDYTLITKVAVEGNGDMLSDGTNIWVGGTSKVTKVRQSDMTILATVNIPGQYGLCYDGKYVYAVNNATGEVNRILASTAAVTGSPVALVAGISAICFDGANIWALNPTEKTVSKIDTASFSLADTITLDYSPSDICFDGVSLWVNGKTDLFTRLSLDGGIIGSYPIETSISSGFGMAFDGTGIWIANWTHGTAKFTP